MTAAMLGVGVEMVIWPDAVAQSKLQFMLSVVGSTALMVFYLVVGALRACALYLNSDSPSVSSGMRAIGAAGGALAWLQMALSLIIAQASIGAPPSPSVPIFLALVAAELYSTYRAACDARRR